MNHNAIKKKIKVKKLQGTPFFISIDQEIGHGSFGTILKAYNKDQPQKEYVAKVIPITPNNKEAIESEVKVLRFVPYHDNLVNCYKSIISSSHNFYLIMQYCNGGSFEAYIEKNRHCSQELVWRFLRQFCKGYQVLYDNHIVHRDIKPENILLHNGIFKIADFGFSRKIYHHAIDQNLSVKGTPLYMAPELEKDQKGNSKVDMFSLGAVLFRFSYSGQNPFYKDYHKFSNVEAYFNYLQQAKLTFPKYPNRSRQLVNLMERMLKKDPLQRISWKELFSHPKIELNKHHEQQKAQDNNELSLQQLRKSIIEINRSSAKICKVQQPVDIKKSIEQQTDELIEFTRFFSNNQFKSFEVYALRRKVIIQLILHLNKILHSFYISESHKQRKWIKKKLRNIEIKGEQYCYHHLIQLVRMFELYSEPINEANSNINKIIKQIQKQAQKIAHNIRSQSLTNDSSHYDKLVYENILYDFLNESVDWEQSLLEEMKILVALMVDLYDASLKIESMAKISEEGRIEMVEIQLEDAELDKIDYSDFSSYRIYLQKLNQVTLRDVQKSLKRIGLFLQ